MIRILFSILFIFTLNITGYSQCLTNEHSNLWAESWVSCQEAMSPNSDRGMGHWIQYDFGDDYFLSTSTIWNSNIFNETNKGVQQLAVDFSSDGVNWITLDTFQLNQAPGTLDYQGEVGPDFQGIKARYVLLTSLSNWGNATCASLAEVRFDVAPSVDSEVDLTIFMEGGYKTENQEMVSFLGNLLPLTHAFANAPFNHTGTESMSTLLPNVIDWVLVEARSGTPSISGDRQTITVEQQALLVLANGSIVDVDGNTPIFRLAQGQAYHFCVRHIGHLDVLSASSLTTQTNMAYDFTTNPNQAFGTLQQNVASDGTAVMIAGDFNNDGAVQTTDYDVWKVNPALLNVYLPADVNFDGSVQTTDYDKWFPNRAKLGSVEIGF